MRTSFLFFIQTLVLILQFYGKRIKYLLGYFLFSISVDEIGYFESKYLGGILTTKSNLG